MKIRVIVNPSAAAGSAGRKIPHLSRIFRRHRLDAEIVTTQRPGDATHLARQALREVEVVAVMGGDGTFHEVAQAFLGSLPLAACGPRLAFIPAGTGGDLKRSLNLTNDLEAAVQRIAQSRCLPMDLGVLTGGLPSSVERVAFLNVASVGLSARVCTLANRGPKWLGGKLTFYAAALRATFQYQNVPLSISVDGREIYAGPVYLVALANGAYFGGGMNIAPSARVDDGFLEVVVLGDYSTLEAVGLSRAIYAGTHTKRANTVVARGKRVDIVPLQPNAGEILEADGETPALLLPVHAELAPAALQVCR